jgi:hypothetical protein
MPPADKVINEFRREWLGIDLSKEHHKSTGARTSVDIKKIVAETGSDYKSIAFDLTSRLLVTQLQGIAKKHGIKTSQLKSLLVTRIIQAMKKDEEAYLATLAAEENTADFLGTAPLEDAPMLEVIPSWEIYKDKFLSEHKEFEVIPISGDGNCMYNCLSMVLYGDQDVSHATLLRNKTADYAEEVMSKDESFVSSVVATNGTYQEWLTGIRGTDWGDHPALVCLLRYCGKNVTVYSSTAAGIFYENFLFGEIELGYIFILHADNHYMLLKTAAATIPLRKFGCPAMVHGSRCIVSNPDFKSLVIHALVHSPDQFTTKSLGDLGLLSCSLCKRLLQRELAVDGKHVTCPTALLAYTLPIDLDMVMNTASVPLMATIPVSLVDDVAAAASRLLIDITPKTDFVVTSQSYLSWYMFWRVLFWKEARTGHMHTNRCVSAVKKRLELWNEGRFESLWNAFAMAGYKAKRRAKRPRGRISEKGVAYRAARLIEAGEIGKALDQFGAKCFTISNDAIFTQLRNTHPDGVPITTSGQMTEAVCFSEDEVKDAVMKSKSSSSPGPDGLSYKYMKQMSTFAGWNTALTFYVNSLTLGKLEVPLRDFIGCARLVAIPKTPTKVRPIAVGNSIRRVWGRLTLKQNSEAIIKQLGLRQMGAGVSCGAEAMYHLFEDRVSRITDGEAVLKADFSNAFNNVSRHVLYDRIVKEYPFLNNYFMLCYEKPVTLYSIYGKIQSRAGVQQGDPLGPILFCIVMEEFLRGTGRRLEDLAYLDDLYVSGKQKDLIAWVKEVVVVGPAYGLYIQESKCKWVSLGERPPEIRELEISQELPSCTSILNAPVGCRGHVDEAMTSLIYTWRELILRVVKVMDPQLALLLIRCCLSGSKFAYHCRVTPPYPDMAWRRSFSETLKDALGLLSGVNIDSWMLSIASICPKAGGLGLRDCLQYYSASYISSVRKMLPAFSARVAPVESKDDDVDMIGDEPPPMARGLLLSHLEMAIAAFNDLVECELPPVSEVLYHTDNLSTMIENKLFNDALVMADERDARLISARRKRYCSEWLLAVPNGWDRFLRFSTPHFRTLLSFYLCGRSAVRRCAKPFCTGQVDEYRDHSLLCRGREMNKRSNLVIDALESYFKKVATVKREERSGYQAERPGDLAVTWTKESSSEKIFIDVSVTHRHIKNAEEKYDKNYVESADQAKRTKYFSTMGHHRFVPFGVSSTGEISSAAWELVNELAVKLQVLQPMVKGIKRGIMRSISCALQTGNALMLCAH